MGNQQVGTDSMGTARSLKELSGCRKGYYLLGDRSKIRHLLFSLIAFSYLAS
jgi:hypothetical protein